MTTQAAVRNVAIFLYQGVEVLDFAGPAEVFSSAGEGAFHVFTIARTREPVVSQRFLKILPDYAIGEGPRPDIVVIPGGDQQASTADPRVIEWIRTVSAGELTMSVCTGAFLLAKAGLLDGLDATTHWSALESLARAAPRTRIVGGERFVDAGRVLTTQGVSAGIDGALHVVQRFLGAEAAWRTARYMQYAWEPLDASPELRAAVFHDWARLVQLEEARVIADPRDAGAQARLGIALASLGQLEHAARHLKRAQQLGYDDSLQAFVLAQRRCGIVV